VQRETLTTDGSGAFGTALITHAEPQTAVVQLRWLVFTTAPVPGTTLLFLNGTGLGQSRLVVAVLGHDTLQLASPLDAWVALAGAPQQSLVAVVSSFGSKLFVGNHFLWTEVVQWCVLWHIR